MATVLLKGQFKALFLQEALLDHFRLKGDLCLLPSTAHPSVPLTSRHASFVAAATAAKSLQSCPTLCDPTDGSPPGYIVPGILQARTLEWVAISFSNAW